MCGPLVVPLLGLAISAASAMSANSAQKQQAKAEDKAIQNAYAHDQTQLAEKYRQDNDQLNQNQTERSKAAMFERGKLNAAYGESGLIGESLDRILNQSDFNLGTDLSTMEANRSNLTKQTMLEGQGLRNTAQSRFNAVTRPNNLDTGLKIAGAAVNAYSSYQATKPPTAPKPKPKPVST